MGVSEKLVLDWWKAEVNLTAMRKTKKTESKMARAGGASPQVGA